MNFVVTRSEWLRGEGTDGSFLLREKDNKKCCFGFLALARGATEEQIRGELTPEDVPNIFEGTNLLFDYDQRDNDRCRDLMEINDSTYNDDSYKEKLLKEKFEKLGITVTFED